MSVQTDQFAGEPNPARPNGNLTKLLALLAVFAVIGGVVAVAFGNRAPRPPAVAELPIPIGGASIDPAIGIAIDGSGAFVAATNAPVVIDIFSDSACPFCAEFDKGYHDQILQLAADPSVSVRFHPVAVLDRSGNGTGFSTKAGAIVLQTAATSPAHLWEVNELLLTNQQAAAAMSDADLINFVSQTGATLPPMDQIMAAQAPLLDQFTAAFRDSGAQGVPHVRINGQQWSPGGLPWPNESLVEAAAAARG